MHYLLLCLLALPLASSPVPNQGQGCPGATGINGALCWLNTVGIQIPPGWDIEYGHVGNGGMAKSDPNRTPPTITIDIEYVASIALDATDAPLVLAVLLFHEYMHIKPNDPWPGGDCGDYSLIPYVASQHCSLITAMCEAGLDITNLCGFYKGVQDWWSEGVGNGSACEQAEKKGCSEAATCGPLPDCPPCTTGCAQ